jgi:phosphoadenosine phosphosulfate reductase
MADIDIEYLNRTFESASPQEILTWAWKTFAPLIAATSSFQSQSLPLLHMIGQYAPDMPVLFLDTGFHFPETLAFRDQLILELGIRVQNLSASETDDDSRRRYEDLHRTDPDLCCYINKVEPLQRAKAGLRAWVTGIRRDQTEARRNTPIISVDRDGKYKICPMATWTDRDVWRYINEHDLPVHPLLQQGYMSIGCAPCTRPVSAGEDYRAGRWAGQNKTECGLHVEHET